MGKAHAPRRGSLQFWPRKRSKHTIARVNSWAANSEVKPLGFIGFKAGMVHVIAQDTAAKSITSGEDIALASTVLECPDMHVVGVTFYKKTINGMKKVGQIYAEKLPKNYTKSICKVNKFKTFDDYQTYDDLRILCMATPASTGIGDKKPKMKEIALGGELDSKLGYAKEKLGQTVSINEVFAEGNLVDLHGITKGKGFQGTTKRYGTPLKHHKAEKGQRGVGNLGAWTPKRVQFQVPMPGKMGFHTRTEYNKLVLKLSGNTEEINPKAGFKQYGVVKNNYLLIKGSVVGSRNRAVLLSTAQRPVKQSLPRIKEII